MWKRQMPSIIYLWSTDFL